MTKDNKIGKIHKQYVMVMWSKEIYQVTFLGISPGHWMTCFSLFAHHLFYPLHARLQCSGKADRYSEPITEKVSYFGWHRLYVYLGKKGENIKILYCLVIQFM